MALSNKKPFNVELEITPEEYKGYSEFRKSLLNASRKENAPIITDDEKIVFKILEQNIKSAAKLKEESYSIGYLDLVHRESLNMVKYNINISKKEFDDLMKEFATEKGLDVKVYNDHKFDRSEVENAKDLGATFLW